MMNAAIMSGSPYRTVRLLSRTRIMYDMPGFTARLCRLSTSTEQIPFYGAPRPNHETSFPPGGSISSCCQRLFLAIDAASTALADPTRADAVAVLGEITGYMALQAMHQRMKNDAIGQRILNEKPIVSTQTLPIEEILKSTPDPRNITFGQAYGEFLRSHGFDPDDRSEVKHVHDVELAYIMLRYRQCHDYWHVLTGLPPTVLGELGLKWLELLQTGLPVAALSATVGSLRLDNHERKILNSQYLPWAVRMSKQSAYLLNVYYEMEFETPLTELRERLCIEPAPNFVMKNS
jgi:ubiquinone biosynthesis protein COQ4